MGALALQNGTVRLAATGMRLANVNGSVLRSASRIKQPSTLMLFSDTEDSPGLRARYVLPVGSRVVEQSPGPGEQARRGSEVRLLLNLF